MSDSEKIDEEARKEWNKFIREFVTKYDAQQFYWSMKTSLTQIENLFINDDSETDTSDYRIDDELS